MAAGIPLIEETGKKGVQNGGRSNSKNDHGYWTLFKNGTVKFFLNIKF